MRVLVTGGTGFVGLTLAQALLERGDEVVLFDRRAPAPLFLERMAPHAARLAAVEGDVLSDDDVGRAFAGGGVTHVFHGAAITAGPQREAAEPWRVMEVNLGGTVRVLQAAARAGVRRAVYPSSLTVYGRHIAERETVSEAGTPPEPDTLYGITKYAGEGTALRLGGLWGMDTVAGRIGSVFGPWEGETGARDMVSPFAQVAAAAARGQAVVLPGAYPRREMIYGPDLAAALVGLLTRPAPAHRCYNLSANLDWADSLARWCEALRKRLPGFAWRYAQDGEPASIDFYGATPRAGMDSARLREDLGVLPRYGRDAALAHYADWVAGHRAYFNS